MSLFSPPLNATTVAQYLRQHPDFFSQQEDLLETLYIPHPVTGNAVSLIAKQLDLLRNKQHKLEAQLAELLEIARENDSSAQKIQQLTLVLLNSPSFATAVINLHAVFRDSFVTDFVTLKIIHTNRNPAFSEIFVCPTAKEAGYIYELTSKGAHCGRLNLAQTRFLFAEVAAEVKSCAIIPLIFKEFNGILVMASRNEHRFHHSKGTLFLNHIGQIVSRRLAALLPP
jgi:uncharacterized protein YigA (DUF484 family)